MIRDSNTKAILNDDAIALNKYKVERNQIRKLDQLAKELEQIKITLTRVCEKIESIEKT
jgi:hypothetical protein